MINDYENKINKSPEEKKPILTERVTSVILAVVAIILLLIVIPMGVIGVIKLGKDETPDNTVKTVVEYVPIIISDSAFVSPEKPKNGAILSVSEHSREIGVLSTSGLTIEELEDQMYAPLSEYAYCFIEAEEETGVNAVFLASVAALESGWGKSNAANTKNNLFGWTTNKGDLKTFNSKEECILFVARKMKEYYLSPDGKYFNGYEVEDINVCYNGRPEWANAVNNIMDNLYS